MSNPIIDHEAKTTHEIKETAHLVLQHCYPTYRTEGYLPSDLYIIIISYLIEYKDKYKSVDQGRTLHYHYEFNNVLFGPWYDSTCLGCDHVHITKGVHVGGTKSGIWQMQECRTWTECDYFNRVFTKYDKDTNQILKRYSFSKNEKDQHGPYKKWYDNGNVQIDCGYRNNVLHGPYKEWHRDGTIKIECFYHDGVQCGPFKEWDKKGKLILNLNS